MPVFAAVLVTDEDTGVPRTVDSDSSGNFEVPNLRAGRYRLEVNAPSFKAFQQTGIVLRAGEVVRADAILSVGERTETVTVTGDPASSSARARRFRAAWTRSSCRRCRRGRATSRASSI